MNRPYFRGPRRDKEQSLIPVLPAGKSGCSHVGLAGDAVSISVETNYNRGDRGFPKGVRLGEISYYDKDNHPLEATAGGRDWRLICQVRTGILSRNIELFAKTSLNSVPAGYYALVEIKAGNLIKIIRVTRS
ncbi:MAG: hypothetical protein V8R91_05560 [Butyricimonas faecihominis]